METFQQAADRGRVHMYYGDGKGKTSAAVGAAIRYAGAGKPVWFCQFLKPETSGERKILEQIPEITVQSGYPVTKFTFAMTDEEREETAEQCRRQFGEIVRIARGNPCGMLVLDEILTCIAHGYLPEKEVTAFLKEDAVCWEVVMTGRNPSEPLLACADYVSEIRSIRHPYSSGLAARAGVEF